MTTVDKVMQTFYDWLSQLDLLRLLRETYFTFNPAQYNAIFDCELETVMRGTQRLPFRNLTSLLLIARLGRSARGGYAFNPVRSIS